MVTLTTFPSLTLLFHPVNKDEYKTWSEKYFIAVSYDILGHNELDYQALSQLKLGQCTINSILGMLFRSFQCW